MARKTIDPTLKKKIVRYLRNHSQNATAQHFKISPSTVNGIANENPDRKIKSEYSAPKKAIEVHKQYAKADRLVVLNKLMGRIDAALNSTELKPGNLRDLSIALGTTLDKFRKEEEGESDEHSAIDDLMEEIKKEAAAYSAKT